MKSKQIFKLFITHDHLLYASIWPNNDKRLFCKYFTVCYVLEKMWMFDWTLRRNAFASNETLFMMALEWNVFLYTPKLTLSTDLVETGLNLQGLINGSTNDQLTNQLFK